MSKFLKVVLPRLRAAPEVILGTACSDNTLQQAESVLGVTIRGDYREFLQSVGWCEFGGDVVFGIGAPPVADLLEVARCEREESGAPLPRYLVPFYNNGAGDLYCIDTRNGGNPRVVCWLHESAEEVFVARSFGNWLLAQLSLRLGGV